MNIRILDKKRSSQGINWFLGEISLWDYLSAITPDNFLFDIQRGIVKNQYLDSILLSIYSNEPIPPITIITDNFTEKENDLNITSFEILDGLQRSYRLWIYRYISEIAEKSENLFGHSYDLAKTLNKLKQTSLFIPGILSVKQIKNLLDMTQSINIENLKTAFQSFPIYLYIWTNLDEKDVIKKMLILNAGQKRVSIPHQYELMFMHILKDPKLIDGIRLVRVKDADYGRIKNGDRKLGEYIFSTLIIGLQSLIANRPLRLSANNLEQINEEDLVSQEIMDKFFNHPFLNAYLTQIFKLDESLLKFDNEYLRWFVKDTTISGIFGAIGRYMQISVSGDIDLPEFNRKFEYIREILGKNNYFHLDKFYQEYNSLSSSRINIGDVVRKAIYAYTLECINGAPISWELAFNSIWHEKN